MKQLHYTIRYLLRGKDHSLIKISSLTLGLAAALVLFSKVAFEMRYDTGFPDSERIYRIQRKIYVDDRVNNETERLYAPVAKDLKTDLGGIEEAAGMMLGVSEGYLQYEDRWIKERILESETSFFDLFGIRFTGGAQDLPDGASSSLYLSESAAERFFGNENAAGKILMKDDRRYTVAGVFEDLPASHLDFDVLLPLETDLGWHNPDCFSGYVKLRQGVSPEDVEAGIKEILPKYMDVAAMAAKGNVQEFYLMPVGKIHSGSAEVKRLTVILSLLAMSLLFVAAMNYVLISVSTLAGRSKSVGIHKCNGASGEKIFLLFIYETAIITGIALVFSVFLISAFGGVIENIIQTSLTAIFSLRNLWVAGVVVAGLLLLAGIMPAAIFSAVPVTHLFRACRTDRRNWKRSLLFVQFSGVAFVATLLLIMVKQCNLLLYNDLGYTTDKVVYTENSRRLSGDQAERIKTEFERLPAVAGASVSSNLPTDRMNGVLVEKTEDREVRFSSRSMGVDEDFLETLQIQLSAGNHAGESSHNYTRAVVNETFAEMMGWEGSPVGRTFIAKGLNEAGTPVTVTGVVKNFKMHTLYKNELNGHAAPLMIFPIERDEKDGLFARNRVILRLHTTDETTLAALNEKLQQVTGRPDTYFAVYRSKIQSIYHETLLYRDAVIVASVILFMITLSGLIGFTDDEVNRRSREIAIRKVFGATIRNVLAIVSKDIIFIAVPSIPVGLMFSFAAGNDWLSQFAEKIPLNLYLFTLSGLSVLSGIIVCVTARTRAIAGENPVNSIKSE